MRWHVGDPRVRQSGRIDEPAGRRVTAALLSPVATGARATIEKLLTLYSRADADLPLLADARALRARIAPRVSAAPGR